MLLIDNDAFFLLSAAGLLDRVAKHLKFHRRQLRRLPTASFVLRGSERVASRFSESYRAAILKACGQIQAISDAPDTALADRLLAVAGIDAGEGTLLALLTERPTWLLITGDLTSLRALATNNDIADVREKLSGRILTLEIIFEILAERDGPASFIGDMVALRGNDPKLESLFSDAQVRDPQAFMEGLESYTRALRRELGPDFLYQPAP